MKVTITEENCIGCGQCEATCSDVFRIEDDGIAHVVGEVNRIEDDGIAHVVGEVKEDVKEDVEMAADGCPTSAINVENA